MGRLLAQTSLQARTRNAMFATVDTNRKIGIGRRALMSTMVAVPAGALSKRPARCNSERLFGVEDMQLAWRIICLL